MRVIYDLIPIIDAAITITASSSATNYPVTNLGNIKPMWRWQSNGVAADAWVKFYRSAGISFDSLFLNRFNFSKFQIQYNLTTDFTPGSGSGYTRWEPIDDSYYNVSTKYFEGFTKDELYDEEFIHYFARATDVISPKYVAIYIPIAGNSPLFSDTNYAIGNFIVGASVDIVGQSQDYTRQKKKKLSVNEFDSGYIETVKLGRTKRVLRGSFKNVNATDFINIRQTDEPFVIYEDCGDPTKAYLVKDITQENNEQFATDRPDLTTFPFEYTELT